MGELFTRDGKFLRVSGQDVFDASGRQVARREQDTLFGPDGRYAGTIIGDRVVYRAGDNVSVRAAFASRRLAGSTHADRPPVAIRGDEPFSPAAAAPRPKPTGPADLEDEFAALVAELRRPDARRRVVRPAEQRTR